MFFLYSFNKIVRVSNRIRFFHVWIYILQSEIKAQFHLVNLTFLFNFFKNRPGYRGTYQQSCIQAHTEPELDFRNFIIPMNFKKYLIHLYYIQLTQPCMRQRILKIKFTISS